MEKEKLQRKHLELDTYAKALNHEKNGIQRDKYDMKNRMKTIDNLRYEVVKEIEKNPEVFNKMNIVAREFERKGESLRERDYVKNEDFVKKREFLNRTSKENQKAVWNVIRKEGGVREMKKEKEYKVFNVEGYMGYLKKVNEENCENQAYINQEKNELMERKNAN